MYSAVFHGNLKVFVEARLQGKMIWGQRTTEDGQQGLCIDFHLRSCLCCPSIETTCQEPIAHYLDTYFTLRVDISLSLLQTSSIFCCKFYVLYTQMDHI